MSNVNNEGNRFINFITAYMIAIMSLSAIPYSSVFAAASYPTKPIRFIVSFAPGGSADIYARVIGRKLTEALNQQVIMDNRVGAAGIVGHELASKSPPDGYTLMLGIMASIAINPALFSTLPYDPKSFAPVTLAFAQPYLMLVPPSLPANTVGEFINLAKSKSGKLNYASVGNGSAPHLASVLFQDLTGTELVHISYKNTIPALLDLSSGQVHLLYVGMVNARPHIISGKVRSIAITSAKRSAVMPEMPTVAESGVPGYEITGWYGVFVPAGTPKEIVARLNREIVKILNAPEMRDRFKNDGTDIIGNTPEEFGDFVKAEIAKWGMIVRRSGARIE